MGQSTDAILFYGYVWDEETELWDDGRSREWFEVLARRRWISSPWDFYRDSGAETEHNSLRYEDQKKAYYYWKESVGFEAMLEEWKVALESIKEEHTNVSVSSHCSCDYPMPYIYVTVTKQQAWRGTPVAVNVETVSESNRAWWDADLNAFITALDIDLSAAQGPGWFLVSNWC